MHDKRFNVLRFAAAAAVAIATTTATAGCSPKADPDETVFFADILPDRVDVSFSTTRVGAASRVETVEFEAVGFQASTIESIAIIPHQGTGAGVFSIVSDPCSDTLLAPAETCALELQFQPRREGIAGASLEVVVGPERRFDIELSGLGVGELQLVPEAVALDFEAVVGESSSPQAVQVEFVGKSEDDEQLEAYVDGANADAFVVTEDCSGRFPVHESRCEATVSFAPTSPGTHAAELWIENAYADATIVLRGTALAAGQFAFEEEPLAAPQTVVGEQSAPFVSVVRNIGDVAADPPDAIGLDGQDPGSFEIIDEGCRGGALLPGETCEVRLVFTPMTSGHHEARLLMEFGTESVVQTIIGEAEEPGFLVISPTSYDFGSVMSGTTTFVVSNAGGTPVGEPQVSLVGPDPGEFALARNSCSGPLDPGESCEVDVGFTPTGPGRAEVSLQVSAMPGGEVSASVEGG